MFIRIFHRFMTHSKLACLKKKAKEERVGFFSKDIVVLRL